MPNNNNNLILLLYVILILIKCFYGLTKLLSSRSLSIDFKIQLYITLIQSVITYGTWPLTKIDKRKLLILEKNIIMKNAWTCKEHIMWRV